MQTNNMDRLIEEYLTDLIAQGKSEYTRTAYRHHLRRFANWCKENQIDFLSLTPRQARSFRNWLMEAYPYRPLRGKKRLTPHTVNMIICAVKSFYDYLYEMELVKGNPIISRRLLVPENRSLPRFLREDELPQIIAAIEKFPPRVQLAFKTMLASGIRVGEAAALCAEDVVIQNGRVLLHIRRGKRGKERYAPVIIPEVAKELVQLKSQKQNGESLFGYRRATLMEYAERAAEMTGIEFTSHRLRHTLGTWLLWGGQPLEVVQEVLGHADISTTRIYAQICPKSFFKLAARVC